MAAAQRDVDVGVLAYLEQCRHRRVQTCTEPDGEALEHRTRLVTVRKVLIGYAAEFRDRLEIGVAGHRIETEQLLGVQRVSVGSFNPREG